MNWSVDLYWSSKKAEEIVGKGRCSIGNRGTKGQYHSFQAIHRRAVSGYEDYQFTDVLVIRED